MAPPPKTALLESRLTNLTAGPAVPESGHVVIQVQFVDFDGQSKKAFYKRLDPTYPKILAMMSVATSVIIRSLLGERAAEDRLVYDDNGEVAGTLSIAIDNFKPFHFGSEGAPVDPQERERVTPSLKTLMHHNIIELLFFSWFLGDDDLHPKNMGLNGRIDYDMFFYNITKVIKGPRTIGGNTNNDLNITVRDFFNFPVLTDSAPTHWPTRQIPENLYYPKRYSNYEQFVLLAGNPTYLDPDTEKTTTAQKQLFTAVLKALLTYQPEVLKKRLKDALGNEALNYKALSVLQQKELETIHPDLFNTGINDKPFIEFMINLYQKYYDELYRKLVFSQGCEKNDAGVAVPAFNRFLHENPSVFQSIKEWVDLENTLLNEKQTLCRAHFSQYREDSTEKNALAKSIKAVSDSRKLDRDELLRRYHQVWRDSFTLRIKYILNTSHELTQKLQANLSLSKNEAALSDTNHEDPSITQAWQIFPDYKEEAPTIIEGRLDCEKDNNLRHGLLLLVETHQTLLNLTKDYFQKEIKLISNHDNTQYIFELQKLKNVYGTDIIKKLGSTTWGNECGIIVRELHRFCFSASFSDHLVEQDQTLQTMVPVRTITRAHTDKEVINDCLNALFNWVKALSPAELREKINKILDKDYGGGVFRTRVQPVKNFLIESEKTISGDDRLAFILSSGTLENGSLNTLLVEKLTKEMVFSTQADINVFLHSVKIAIEDNTFNAAFYTEKAVHYAKNNDRFHHLYSKNVIQKVNKALYQWVATIPDKQFQDLVYCAVSSYEKTLWGSFWNRSRSRKNEINGFFKKMDSNPQILAAIFKQGGLESNSLNTLLFDGLISAMKQDIIRDNEKLQQEQFKLILQIVDDKTKSHFLGTIQPFAQSVDGSTFQEFASASTELVA